jgi:hypothetical protein
VLCQITPLGLGILARLDAPVDAVNDTALRMLDEPERKTLVELLGAVRAGCTGSTS